MNKTKTIKAIDKLIKKYKLAAKNKDINYDLGSSRNCSLCIINHVSADWGNGGCKNCVNHVFASQFSYYPCVDRTYEYTLSWSKDYSNLVTFWTEVKIFLSSREEEIEITDIKDNILEIAKPFKNK